MSEPATILAGRSRSVACSLIAIPLAVLVAATLLAMPSGASGTAASTASGTAPELLARLKTAAEHPAGYDRDLFEHWIDADDDGCSTRSEVLIAESRTTVQIGDHCAVAGSWRSAYDGVITIRPGSFDIDHMVPLKEAWDSGAWAWISARREDFANDLGDWRSLRAVTAASNRSKGDKDPAQWLPPRVAFRCIYATEWIAVKVRWTLRVDAGERAALEDILDDCPVRTVRVTIKPAPTTTLTPTPAPTSTPTLSPSASADPSPTATPSP